MHDTLHVIELVIGNGPCIKLSIISNSIIKNETKLNIKIKCQILCKRIKLVTIVELLMYKRSEMIPFYAEPILFYKY